MDTRTKWFSVLVPVLFFLISEAAFAQESLDSDNHYLPYLQVVGTKNYRVDFARYSAGAYFFVPIWQRFSDLVYSDIRMLDLSGKPFVGGAHLGYRHLDSERQHIYGIYTALERKRTILENYFNQLIFGVECWLNHFFVGGNVYRPVGSATMDRSNTLAFSKHEEAMPGVDAEVGYELIKGVTGYVGGYYFKGKKVDNKYGPKARLTLDWSLADRKRILQVIDKVGLEVGIRRDKPQGVVWYLNANIRISMLNEDPSVLRGVSSHMVDLIRSTTDVVTAISDIRVGVK